MRWGYEWARAVSGVAPGATAQDVELRLRLVAAWEGPGRLTAAVEFEGRRYACVGETAALGYAASIQVTEPQYEVEQMGSGEWWTNCPDPWVRAEQSGLGGGSRMSDYSVTLVVLGPRGYVEEAAEAGEDGFAPGHYRVTVGGSGGVGGWLLLVDVWIGEELPVTYGECLFDVTEGTWEAVTGHGLMWAQGMCVSDGRLWMCGEDEVGTALVQGWDGTDWVGILDSPALKWLWDVAGVLHGAGDTGCYRLENWSWVPVSTMWRGDFGIAVDGKVRWMGDALAWRTVCLPAAPVNVATKARFALVARGGRAFVVQDAEEGMQELGWIDGAGVRGLVRWGKDGADLDNLASWANRLWAFGVDAEGTPMRLRLGSGKANIGECGPWRIDQGSGEVRLLAIGRLGPDMSVGRAGYGVGQVVLETALDVMLHELRHEASDGTGETPMLQELRHEAVIVPVPPVMLEEVVHEASEGTGETPVLQELMHEGSDGTGETPELWEIVHEAIVPEDGRLGGATLEEVRHEAAQGVPGPVAGEHAWLLKCQARGNVDMVRIVTHEPLGEDWRALMRLDRQGMSKTAWDTFEVVPLMADHSPVQVGSYVEVWIIGAVGRTEPVPVTVAYRCS